jgi:hypothetical protein
MPAKFLKMALNSGIQTYKILAKYDEVCIPSPCSIPFAVTHRCRPDTMASKYS